VTSTAKGAIIGGCVGLAVMFVLVESDASSSGLMDVLWPASGFLSDYHAEGRLIGLVVGAIEVGVQFLIYAAVGWVVGLVVGKVRGDG
jgi:hypothetical protein